MHSILELEGKKLDIYFNDKVYSPEYSSEGTILLVNKLVFDGGKPTLDILDVGCGSGFLGLGVKLFNPFCSVTLSDVDSEALRITKLNAKRNGLKVSVVKSDLIPKVGTWHIIMANLPTFKDEDMEKAVHGPRIAYFGEGMTLYEKLFKTAQGRCKALVCECQPKYQTEFKKLAKDLGWTEILSSGDSFAFIYSPAYKNP